MPTFLLLCGAPQWRSFFSSSQLNPIPVAVIRGRRRRPHPLPPTLICLFFLFALERVVLAQRYGAEAARWRRGSDDRSHRLSAFALPGAEAVAWQTFGSGSKRHTRLALVWSKSASASHRLSRHLGNERYSCSENRPGVASGN